MFDQRYFGRLITVAAAGSCLLFTGSAWSEIYRHVDANGVVSFTNIPPKGRKKQAYEVYRVNAEPRRKIAVESAVREETDAPRREKAVTKGIYYEVAEREPVARQPERQTASLTRCYVPDKKDPVYRWVDAKGVAHFTDDPGRGDNYALYEASSFLHISGESVRPPVARMPVMPAASRRDLPRILQLVRYYSSQFNLEEALVRAVIKVESNYNHLAVSNKGAQGLMQLIPRTAQEMNVTDPFDMEDNIRGGSRYLRLMLDMFSNNLDLALAAYNAGPAAVQRYGGIPPYIETQNYVQRVKNQMQIFQGQLL